MVFKKILNIAILCDPIGHQIAGSFVSTMRFAHLLSKKGHKVIFIAAKYKDVSSIDFYNGIKIYRFASIKLPKSDNQFYLGFPTENKIKEIFQQEKINILHIMIPTPSVFATMRAAKSLGIPIVAHSHTQPENILLNIPKILRTEILHKLFYKYLINIYKKADILICPSKFSERQIKEYSKNIKTLIISNGVDLSKFKKSNNKKFVKKHKLNLLNKRILFVGRLNPEKSVETLIKAMPIIIKNYNNIHLDIVGTGNMQLTLVELSKKLRLEKYITFFGKVSDQDLILAYNSCDLFCLPSLAELEGMVVLEAMACGKPLLIANSDNSASVYFVNDNGFLFKPKDPLDLANKAIKILKNNKLRKTMAEKSYQTARNYDINKSIDQVEKVYFSLIKK